MSFEDKEVFIPIDFSLLENKNFKMPIMLYIADNSVYTKDEIRVYSEKINYSEIAKKTTLKDRRMVKKALDYLKAIDNKIVCYDETKDKIYFNNENQDFIVSLSHKTLKRMYTNFSDYTCKIFFYLFRQYCYWTKVRGDIGFNFTLSQLCEAIGLSPQTKNREVVKEALNQLVINGMIGYDIIKKGQTYYRRLTTITTEFVVSDFLNMSEEKIIGGLPEEKTDNLLEEQDIVLTHVGISAKELTKLPY